MEAENKSHTPIHPDSQQTILQEHLPQMCEGGRRSKHLQLRVISPSCSCNTKPLRRPPLPHSTVFYTYYPTSKPHLRRSDVTFVSVSPLADSIRPRAFDNWTVLQTISIPLTVCHLGDRAFQGCESLMDVTIPQTITTLENYVFHRCHNLTRVRVGERMGMTLIGKDVFYDCVAGLGKRSRSANTDKSVEDTDFDDSAGVTLPPTITSLGTGAFSWCTSLTSVTLPSTVSTLGERLFSHCRSLRSIILPPTIVSLGNAVFYGCGSLTTVDLGPRITKLGPGMFHKCGSLVEVRLSSKITEIGDGAFYACASLTEMIVPPGVTTIGSRAFYECSSLTSLTLPPALTMIGDEVFSDCDLLGGLILPPNLTMIGDGAFSGCSSLVSMNIPSGISEMGRQTFKCCTALESVWLPKNLISVAVSAFEDCSNLSAIIGPSFSTKSLKDHPNGFESLLVSAKWSPTDPETILSQSSPRTTPPIPPPCTTPVVDIYYSIAAWARTSGLMHRLPLAIAAARSVPWTGTQKVFRANMTAVYKIDGGTGLPLFALAAVGNGSDLESVYGLLRESLPVVVRILHGG